MMGIFSKIIKTTRLAGFATAGLLIATHPLKVLAQPNLETLLNKKISEVQADFKSLNMGFFPEVDYQRAFANQSLWIRAHSFSLEKPWTVLGREKMFRWQSVSRWVSVNTQSLEVSESTVKEFYQRLGIALDQLTLQQVATATQSYRANSLVSANSPVDQLTHTVNLYVELYDLFVSKKIDPQPLQHLLDLMALKQGLPPTLEHINPTNHQDLTKVFFDVLGGFQRYVEAKKTSLIKPKAPTTLYHWTNAQSLAKKMKDRTNPEMPPTSLISEDFLIVEGRDDLIGKKALFTWNNPFGAIADGVDANGNKKWYAGKDSKNGRLVILDIKTQARVLFLRTIVVSEDVIITDPVQNLKEYDLIYHIVQEADRTRAFSEWVIINPEVVASFTAEQDAVKSRLLQAIETFRRAPPEIPRDELHLPNMPLTRSEILDHISGVLGLPQTSLKTRSCQNVFL